MTTKTDQNLEQLIEEFKHASRVADSAVIAAVHYRRKILAMDITANIDAATDLLATLAAAEEQVTLTAVIRDAAAQRLSEAV